MQAYRFIATSCFALGLGLVGVGCAVAPTDGASEGAPTEQVESSEQPLQYTCTESGACQCRDFEDCNSMFRVCKSFLYCNYDKIGGFRCICLNYPANQLQPLN